MNFGKQQNLQILEVSVSMAGSVWSWCSVCPASGAFHKGELPKTTPSQVTTEPAGEDAQCVEWVRKFFTQSGRRSREGEKLDIPALQRICDLLSP